MVKGSVIALFAKPNKGDLAPVDQHTLIGGNGIEGDTCFGNASRQVLCVSKEDLDDLGIEPGSLREQITVDFCGLQSLEPQTYLQIGGVQFQVEMECEPCSHMARRLGEDPETFKARAERRRGMFLLTRSTGTIKVGDAVEVITV